MNFVLLAQFPQPGERLCNIFRGESDCVKEPFFTVQKIIEFPDSQALVFLSSLSSSMLLHSPPGAS